MKTLAMICAAAALLLNVVLERALMNITHDIPLIPGLADFHRAWNHGVSFSLLSQNSDSGRWLLMGFLLVIIAFVSVLAWKSPSRLSAAGYGLILGGALGNLVDRAMYGAVFDFLALHIGDVPLFVCNFADIAISAGVLLLLLESFLPDRNARRA